MPSVISLSYFVTASQLVDVALAESLNSDSPNEGYSVLAVLIGGATGAVVRVLTNAFCAVPTSLIPVPTLIVNFVGSFIIGLATSLFALSTDNSFTFYRNLLLVGFCGGLTTFSTLCLETLILSKQPISRSKLSTTSSSLVTRRTIAISVGNLLLHNFVCIGLVFFGLAIGHGFNTTVSTTYVG